MRQISTTEKKGDSKWKESILEASDIFLALIVGIVFEEAITNSLGLIAGIEVPIVLIVIAIAVLVKRYRSPRHTKYFESTR